MTELQERVRYLTDFAKFDANYARWRARQISKQYPEEFAELPQALDKALTAAGIRIPAAWSGVLPSRLPVQPTDGERVMPRPFFERLRNEQ